MGRPGLWPWVLQPSGGAWPGGQAGTAASHLKGGKTTIYQGCTSQQHQVSWPMGRAPSFRPSRSMPPTWRGDGGRQRNVDTNVFGYIRRRTPARLRLRHRRNGSSSYILTNYHVIDGNQRHQGKAFFSDGKSYDATLVGGEKGERQCCAEKLRHPRRSPQARAPDQLNVGEDCMPSANFGELTLHFHWGLCLPRDRSVTMSDGTVMNMFR